MIKHGHRKIRTPTYHSWNAMKQRCTNQNRADFKHYGGRGISFDPSWSSFAVFLEDMGERPPKTSLDRIDVNGDYKKANCRWANAKEQANNKRKPAYDIRYKSKEDIQHDMEFERVQMDRIFGTNYAGCRAIWME